MKIRDLLELQTALISIAPKEFYIPKLTDESVSPQRIVVELLEAAKVLTQEKFSHNDAGQVKEIFLRITSHFSKEDNRRNDHLAWYCLLQYFFSLRGGYDGHGPCLYIGSTEMDSRKELIYRAILHFKKAGNEEMALYTAAEAMVTESVLIFPKGTFNHSLISLAPIQLELSSNATFLATQFEEVKGNGLIPSAGLQDKYYRAQIVLETLQIGLKDA